MLKDLLPLFAPDDCIALRLIRKSGPSKDILTTYQDIASGEADKKLKKLLEDSPPTDVFFGVCPRDAELEEFNLQCQIRRLRALWLDVDAKGLTEDDVMAALADAGLPPASLIVSSGRGWHCYWILKTCVEIDDYPPFNLERSLAHGWTAKIGDKTYRSSELIGLSDTATELRSIIGGIAQSVEGGDTKTRDLSRILRVPGYRSTKPGAGMPKRTHYDPEALYDLEAFDDFLLMESNKVTRGRLEGLAASLLRIKTEGENDGSNRLMKYVACCKREGLNAQQTVEVVRKVSVDKPFPRDYSDADIEARWEQSKAKPTTGKPTLRNYEPVEKGAKIPRPTEEIYRDVVRRHRLYCIGGAVHVFSEGSVVALAKPAGLMAWLNDHFIVDWAEQTGMLTKGEFLAYLSLKSPRYEAIEVAPHFPEQEERVAYLAPALNVGVDEGQYLEEILDGFKPATEWDRELIRALFMTVLWGGSPSVAGRRPAWMISTKGGRQTGVGGGKTTLAHVVSMLSSLGRAGPIEIKGGNVDGEIALAVANDPTKRSRVMLIDNWKRERTRSDAIESLITAPTVSGRIMYVGPVSVRNSFTLIFTSNTAEEASTDMATRTVHIKLEPLKEGDRTAGWDKWVSSIDYERLAADVAWTFGRDPVPVNGGNSRWQLWLAEIVGRCNRAQEVVDMILRRQSAMDGSRSDTVAIESIVTAFLKSQDIDPARAKIYLPWQTVASILGDEFGKLHNGILVKRLVREIESERLRINRDTSRRGYLWIGEDSGPIQVDYEIHQKWDDEAVFPAD